MARRSYGTGSIYVKAGSWYGRWWVGDRRVKRKLGPVRQPGSRDGLTKAQAERELRRRMESEPLSAPTGGRLTLTEAGERLILIDYLEALGRKPTTIGVYKSLLRTHLATHFRDRPLDRVRPEDVEGLIARMRRGGAGAKTVGNALTLLGQIFDHGIRKGWCATNPVKRVDRPRVEQSQEIRFLDPAEVEALLRATTSPTDRALFLTAAMTGLRQGDCLACNGAPWIGRRGRSGSRTSPSAPRPSSRRSSRRTWSRSQRALPDGQGPDDEEAPGQHRESPRGVRLVAGEGRRGRLADVGWSLWMFWWLSGSYHREGRQLMEQVLARSDELSPCGAARALASRGLIAFWQADYSGAVPDLTAALERFRQEGDDQGTGYTLSALALIEPCSSAGASGEEKLREAQRLIVATGDEWGAMLATNGLLWGLQATGRLPESDEEYRSALAEAEALGSPHELGMAHANIGRYRLYRQEGEAALPHLEEWLDQLEQLSQKGTLPSAFEAIAEASDLLGDPERATRLFAAASALRREIAAPARTTAKERLDMNVGRLQAQLGESELRAAWTEGECLTLEDALSAARVAPAELRL